MKLFNLLLISFSFMMPFQCLSQGHIGESAGVNEAKIYLVKWNSRFIMPITIDNIIETHDYYFEVRKTTLSQMFFSLEDCREKLGFSEKVNPQPDKKARVAAELFFKDGHVTIFFNNYGDYYFNDTWYSMNPRLYHYLFHYLSDYLLPQETLERAKKEADSKTWGQGSDE